MKQRIIALAATALAMLYAVPSLSADDAFGKDLKVTIALQGMPCDAVVEAKHNGDSDYTVACKDGNHYHVFVNPQGRVIVQKL